MFVKRRNTPVFFSKVKGYPLHWRDLINRNSVTVCNLRNASLASSITSKYNFFYYFVFITSWLKFRILCLDLAHGGISLMNDDKPNKK